MSSQFNLSVNRLCYNHRQTWVNDVVRPICLYVYVGYHGFVGATRNRNADNQQPQFGSGRGPRERFCVSCNRSHSTFPPNYGYAFESSFFRNKGAVAGVFVVVGLAATAVVLFVLFWFRRRRATRLLDHDTAVAATLAEHGYGRQNLIDADDDHRVSAPVTTTTPSGSGSGSDMRRVSSPSMTLPGFGTGPISASGYGRQSHNTSYLADSLGQTYNPYTNNQPQHYDTNRGPSDPSETSRYSPPSTSGVVRPFFGHDPKDSLGSSEPLLGAIPSGSATPPDHTTPVVPPRNPLRLIGGTGSRPDSNNGYRGVGGSIDENGGYEDDFDSEYDERLRRQSLKVRSGVVDPIHPSDA